MDRMPAKRPAKIKTAIAKMRGVERDRALFSQDLADNRDYSSEAADLLAFAVYPFDDDIPCGAAFAKEMGSLAMDIGAMAETAEQGAAVHGAALAVRAYRGVAEEHGEKHYIAKFDRELAGLERLVARFGD
jgi:hypothetical protein